jgi:hypothetical protein
MVARPGAPAVTTPSDETAAISGALLAQVTT